MFHHHEIVCRLVFQIFTDFTGCEIPNLNKSIDATWIGEKRRLIMLAVSLLQCFALIYLWQDIVHLVKRERIQRVTFVRIWFVVRVVWDTIPPLDLWWPLCHGINRFVCRVVVVLDAVATSMLGQAMPIDVMMAPRKLHHSALERLLHVVSLCCCRSGTLHGDRNMLAVAYFPNECSARLHVASA